MQKNFCPLRILVSLFIAVSILITQPGIDSKGQHNPSLGYIPVKASVLLYPAADSFRFPLDGAWTVLLDFGGYNQPRFSGRHLGEDAKAAALTPLYAVANGVVKHNSYVNGYMNVVIIEHTLPDNSKVTSVYGHMTSNGIIPVGTEVSKGQLIGTLDTAAGFSANGYIQHLHFGIRKGAYTSTWVYYGYEKGSETIDNWYDPSDFILSHSGGGTTTCPAPSSGNPRDNVILNNNQVTFSWTPPDCTGLDYYTFRVSNHADIDNQPWIIDQGVDKNVSNISINIPSQYNGQTLYWAIWPHNSAGYGPKGGPWQFKIDTSAPPPPVVLPADSWSVQYFGNKELNSPCSPASSFNDTFVFKDWGDNAPASGCPGDNWSARMIRNVYFQGGHYDFAIEADDWGRIYVDGVLFVDKWNTASQHYEGHDVSTGTHEVRVEFADTLGAAKVSAWWWGPGFEIPHDTQDSNQWYASYWINPTQWWDPFAKQNEGSGILNHQWNDGGPGWDMPADNFSARFERTVSFECGTYRFILDHDDGARFYLDGMLEVDRWNGVIGNYSFDLPISRGSHALKLDMYENGGAAHISFDWQQISGCSPATPSLSTPSSLSNLAWNSDVTLSWDPSSGATQYFTELQGGPGVNISSGWISGTQWHVGSLWPGVYTWSTTARNDYGSSASSAAWTFTIQDQPAQPPVVDFNASPTSGQAPLAVTFHNLTAGAYTSCSWDYGDGQTSTTCAEYHSHTYSSNGTYTVVLAASGPGGSDTLQRTGYIQVNQIQTFYRWKGEYFTNANLSGIPALVRDDFHLDFDWGYNSPDPAIPLDNFSVRWTRSVYFAAGNYRFHLNHDDGGRLYIDGNIQINAWDHCCTWEQQDVALTEGYHTLQVEMSEISGAANVEFWWERLDINGWRAEYFNNPDLFERPTLVRNDPEINFTWYSGSPDPMIVNDGFSVRWTRSIYFPKGTTIFHLNHDDGARLYVDGVLILDNWCSNCVVADNAEYALGTAGYHTVKVEMYENSGWSSARLWIENDHNDVFLPVILR